MPFLPKLGHEFSSCKSVLPKLGHEFSSCKPVLPKLGHEFSSCKPVLPKLEQEFSFCVEEVRKYSTTAIEKRLYSPQHTRNSYSWRKDTTFFRVTKYFELFPFFS
jgi:hypothetical protein